MSNIWAVLLHGKYYNQDLENFIIYSLQQSYEEGVTIISVLQMRKLRDKNHITISCKNKIYN